MKSSSQQPLFAAIKPFHESYLKVSPIHELWYAEYGNPDGIPAIVLHGGPGAGCDEETVKLFDPTFWRIILLDQRAVKRSRQLHEMQDNTTQHLVEDIECLRKELSIDKWLLFGGSWGSTLALAYGEAYPKHVLGFILRGIFLGRKHENNHLWYGMRNIFPDAWEELHDFLPSDQRHDLIGSYHKRIMDTDLNIAIPAARSFIKYDITCSFLNLPQKQLESILSDNQYVLGLAKTFVHYSENDFFLRENQLIDNIGLINQLPLIIVHGRYDIITLPTNAYELHKLWPGSDLVFSDAAGHSAKEPPNALNLLNATEKMRLMV